MTATQSSTLARYSDGRGQTREVIRLSGAGDSVLVVDRDVATGADRRLVAHLAADEAPGNAALVCGHYLEDLVRHGHDARRCRRVTDADARTAPFGERAAREAQAPRRSADPVDGRGRRYRLRPLRTGMSIPELRWCRLPPNVDAPGGVDEPDGHEAVSLREGIAALESYDPLRELTVRALRLHGTDGGVSTTALRAEWERVQTSPIVLNRRLREAVLLTVERRDLSMSEIAIRCGRVKRDRNGNESGETSWLARRLGLAAEGGHGEPTPWIHSDVLALIAREGLGISPHEVEL